MARLRWWEYPFAVGTLVMVMIGGIHHSIKHRSVDQ